METRHALPRTSGALHHRIIIVLYLLDPILCDNLHQHPLEIHRQSPLQLVRAQSQDLHPLLIVNVGVVVLIKDREAVVSVETNPSAFKDPSRQLSFQRQETYCA